MEATPVSRASLQTKCGGMRLQSCPSTPSFDAVGLEFFFITSSSDRVKEPFQPLFFALTEELWDGCE